MCPLSCSSAARTELCFSSHTFIFSRLFKVQVEPGFPPFVLLQKGFWILIRQVMSPCPVRSFGKALMRAETPSRCWAVASTSSPAGDILLNVNGVDLTGVTRGEAVANLKNTSSPVVLKVLEMRPPEDSLQDCALPPCLVPSPTDSTKSPLPNDDYSPVWVSWLQLPR